MKILIFGAKGYLGQQFLSLYPDAIATGADIAEVNEVREALAEHQPDVVINTAGKTGRPNIDWCEDHKEETMRANVTGPLVLLNECLERDIYLVHLSSGCIYSGDNEGRGFTEEDAPNFTGSFYSRTKAQADQLLGEFSDKVLILRLRMPFDGTENQRSLIQKLIKYPKVHDLPNSLTYMPDFMKAAQQLIEQRATGIFNVVNPGTSSPYKIMSLYKEIVDPEHEISQLSDEEVATIQKVGRSNCLLNTDKLEQYSVKLLPIETAVAEALQSLARLR